MAYRFYGFCRSWRCTNGGKRNVCCEQYTERASLPISFSIKQLREDQGEVAVPAVLAGVQFRDSCCSLRQA
ncbi:hypothetical protein EMIT0P2_60016 [Pseudomonas sp. IT-P2]